MRRVLDVFAFCLFLFVHSGCGVTLAGNPGVEEDEIDDTQKEQPWDREKEIESLRLLYDKIIEKNSDFLVQEEVKKPGINKDLDELQKNLESAYSETCHFNPPDWEEFLRQVNSIDVASEFMTKRVNFEKNLEDSESHYQDCRKMHATRLESLQSLQKTINEACYLVDEVLADTVGTDHRSLDAIEQDIDRVNSDIAITTQLIGQTLDSTERDKLLADLSKLNEKLTELTKEKTNALAANSINSSLPDGCEKSVDDVSQQLDELNT